MAQEISIVIPTCGRDAVLVDSIRQMLELADAADEVLVIDQTAAHDANTQATLSGWSEAGRIRWIRHQPPGHVGALNRGLAEARGDIALIVDDDIVPSANLVAAHRCAYERYPQAWAVVGQVLQPEDVAERDNRELSGEPQKAQTDTEREAAGAILKSSESNSFHSPNSRFKGPLLRILRLLFSGSSESIMRRDLDFQFNGTEPGWVENVITCNLSVDRKRIQSLGGFDDRFVPPVSYRAETELAKRIIAAGGKIRFEPKASVHHLRTARGGTRIGGGHLASASPLHGVGDYYYALKHGRGWDRIRYIARRPFREVCTKFHLRHPWWIPVKLVGELRAMWMAWKIWIRC